MPGSPGGACGMKIGVVSLKVNANYGGLLQAWALQQVLTRMGHEPELIDAGGPYPLTLIKKLTLYPPRLLKKYLLRSPRPVRREKLDLEGWEKAMARIYPFIDCHIKRRVVRSLAELRQDDYDMILFGSDQVWRPAYFRGSFGDMRHAFGWFARDWHEMRLASYAASFGLDTLEEFLPSELETIRTMLPRFKGVSVREVSGVKLCDSLGVSAEHVLDPTMLLDRTDYISLASGEPKSEGLMTYLLDPSDRKDEIVDALAARTSLPVFATAPRVGESPEGVERWIAGFRDAGMVVTDSFHACVFSVLFGKPFVVIDNPGRGSARIDSLLDTFSLSHHKVDSPEALQDPAAYALPLSSIAATLHHHRQKSKNFLQRVMEV